MKAITKPVLGAVIEIGVLKHTNAIYFCITRLENASLQVEASLRGRGVSRKTFSSRVIHKSFSADNLLKANSYLYN
jgi:hypothetical protein